jgi:hypothetical protein
MAEIAQESGHWYDRAGTPAYTVIGKNGNKRNTTLRDARQHGYCPSVTTILRCAAKPALDLWKQNQVLLAALTLPRIIGETDEAFCARVMEDSKRQAKEAAETGSSLHAAIELHLQGRAIDPRWTRHVVAVEETLLNHGIPLRQGKVEHSFCSAKGFGGKVDWHSGVAVLDFKSKPKIDAKTAAYDEHLMQLSAYGDGLGLELPRMLNVFVGVQDAQVLVHEWSQDDGFRGWTMFDSLLKYWKAANKYDGAA